MSTVVAVKKNGYVAISSDGLCTLEDGQQLMRDNYVAKKICRVGESWLGYVGWYAYANYIQGFIKDNRNLPELTSEQGMFEWIIKFVSYLKQTGILVNLQGNPGNPFIDLDVVFLAINGNGIFCASGNLGVSKLNKYYAIGVGSDYALGALQYLYEQPTLSTGVIASKAVEAANNCNVLTAGPITTHVLVSSMGI